jgi:hypothetical protein
MLTLRACLREGRWRGKGLPEGNRLWANARYHPLRGMRTASMAGPAMNRDDAIHRREYSDVGGDQI